MHTDFSVLLRHRHNIGHPLRIYRSHQKPHINLLLNFLFDLHCHIGMSSSELLLHRHALRLQRQKMFTISVSRPDMSSYDQEKTSTYSRSNSINPFLIDSSKSAPIFRPQVDCFQILKMRLNDLLFVLE